MSLSYRKVIRKDLPGKMISDMEATLATLRPQEKAIKWQKEYIILKHDISKA